MISAEVARIVALVGIAFTLLLAGGEAVAKPKPQGGCTNAQIQSDDPKVKECFDKINEDLLKNVKNPHYLACSGGKMECCQRLSKNVVQCSPINARAGRTDVKAPGGPPPLERTPVDKPSRTTPTKPAVDGVRR